MSCCKTQLLQALSLAKGSSKEIRAFPKAGLAYRWEGPDGATRFIHPLVAQVATTLLGRDVFQALEVVLIIQSERDHIMLENITYKDNTQ